MDCLIVIDPQMDFVSAEGAYARRGHGTSNIRRCLGSIHQALLNQEKNRILVYSNYAANQFGPGLNLCIPGSPGHRIALSVENFDTVLAKTDHDAIKSSELPATLEQLRPRRIFLCGFLLEYCVRKTALSLLEAGWPVTIYEDLIATGDDVLERKITLIQELESLGAVIGTALATEN